MPKEWKSISELLTDYGLPDDPARISFKEEKLPRSNEWRIRVNVDRVHQETWKIEGACKMAERFSEFDESLAGRLKTVIRDAERRSGIKNT